MTQARPTATHVLVPHGDSHAPRSTKKNSEKAIIMSNRKVRLASLSLATIAALGIAACGQAADDSASASSSENAVNIDGGSTLSELKRPCC